MKILRMTLCVLRQERTGGLGGALGVQREGELAESSPDVGAFEGALRGAHLDKLVVCEDDGAGPVPAEVVGVLGVVFEHGG